MIKLLLDDCLLCILANGVFVRECFGFCILIFLNNFCQRHKDQFVITRQTLIAVIFSENTGSHE